MKKKNVQHIWARVQCTTSRYIYVQDQDVRRCTKRFRRQDAAACTAMFKIRRRHAKILQNQTRRSDVHHFHFHVLPCTCTTPATRPGLLYATRCTIKDVQHIQRRYRKDRFSRKRCCARRKGAVKSKVQGLSPVFCHSFHRLIED